MSLVRNTYFGRFSGPQGYHFWSEIANGARFSGFEIIKFGRKWLHLFGFWDSILQYLVGSYQNWSVFGENLKAAVFTV